MSTLARKLRVFLCHASQDKASIRELYKKLLAEGWIEPWLDEEKLLPGQDFHLEINKATRDTDVIIICLSKASVVKEGYVNREIRRALDIAQEKLEGEIYIIPLRLDDCDPSFEQLKKLHWVNYFEGNGYERLKKSLAQRFVSLGGKVSPDSGLSGNELLLHQLIHGTDAERIEAAKAIRSLGLINALPELISVMRYDPEKSRETIPVRNAARDSIIYLAGQHREQVISAMQRIIKDKAQHRYVRRRAVYILGKLEANEALADLVGLTDDPDFQLKCKLIDILKQFRTHELALSALMKLSNDPSKEIQERARVALSK